MDLHSGLPVPRRYWAILAISLSTALAVIDSTIVNVALPTIARDFHVGSGSSILIINAYQLATAASLLPLAALGDNFGYRRVSQCGLALFVMASLGCALASSLTALTIARVFQGLGAAGAMCVSSALVRVIYPANQLGRGIGINSMVVAISSALGPTLGGVLLSIVTWPWLFAINIPFGLLALIIGARNLPDNHRSEAAYDVRSALLNVLTFGLLSTAISGSGYAQAGSLVAVESVMAFVIGGAFVRRQLSQTTPLLPVDLLRQPMLAFSFATSLFAFIAQMLVLVTLPFYLQDVAGLTPLQTGLVMTPWPLTIAVMAPIAGYLADRFAPGGLGSAGLCLASSGIGLLALLPSPVKTGDIVWRMMICGAGFALFMTPNARFVISSTPRERSGSVAGMIATVRLTGQTIGAALAASMLGLVPDGSAPVALWVAAAIALLAAGLSLLRLGVDRR